MPVESPSHLRRHVDALRRFEDAYTEYLRTGPDHPDSRKLREAVIEQIPSAQEALGTVGGGLLVSPPPMTGSSFVYQGLFNTAFLHERSAVYGEIPEGILDSVRLAIAELRKRESEARKTRRNPLYWADRVLTSVLGLPSYLVAKVIGVPVARIEQSVWGTVLKLIEVALAILGVFFAGRAAGWW